MIAPPVEGGVNIVLVKENLFPGVADAGIPDVSPVPALGRGVEGLGDVCGVTLVHVIVEGPRVRLSMYVRGGVDDDPSLTLAEEKSDGG